MFKKILDEDEELADKIEEEQVGDLDELEEELHGSPNYKN